MTELKILPCGTQTETIIGNIKGMITGISIRFNYVNYEFTYMLNGELKTYWLREYELKFEGDKQKIGFK